MPFASCLDRTSQSTSFLLRRAFSLPDTPPGRPSRCYLGGSGVKRGRRRADSAIPSVWQPQASLWRSHGISAGGLAALSGPRRAEWRASVASAICDRSRLIMLRDRTAKDRYQYESGTDPIPRVPKERTGRSRTNAMSPHEMRVAIDHFRPFPRIIVPLFNRPVRRNTRSTG